MHRNELLVIDVEATCWQGPAPTGQASEIIEIGVCRVELDAGTVSNGRGVFVRPARSEVSAFCTSLTTITPEMAAGGVPFAEACALLEAEYGTHAPGRVWASYGDYDRKQFERQCAADGVRYPFGPRHVNVKRAFAEAKGLAKPVGMAGALRLLGLPLAGTHHRGADDAANIARIALWLYREGRLPLFQPAAGPGSTARA